AFDCRICIMAEDHQDIPVASVEPGDSPRIVYVKTVKDVCPSVYYISTSRKSWHESRKDCLERGADLLIINSQEEQKFMIQFKRPFWIGLIYAAREKEWKWIDGTLLNTRFGMCFQIMIQPS
uniref:C-type lectin domain-containing protein n=1 Tax=Cyprinodon variegatus TaxID=28743 RepID=A0A3Q2E291_CYPVA